MEIKTGIKIAGVLIMLLLATILAAIYERNEIKKVVPATSTY